jgi:hypothetical protein
MKRVGNKFANASTKFAASGTKFINVASKVNKTAHNNADKVTTSVVTAFNKIGNAVTETKDMIIHNNKRGSVSTKVSTMDSEELNTKSRSSTLESVPGLSSNTKFNPSVESNDQLLRSMMTIMSHLVLPELKRKITPEIEDTNSDDEIDLLIEKARRRSLANSPLLNPRRLAAMNTKLPDIHTKIKVN